MKKDSERLFGYFYRIVIEGIKKRDRIRKKKTNHTSF